MNSQESGRLGAAKRTRIFDDMDRHTHKPWVMRRPCEAADCYRFVLLSASACFEHGGPVEEEEG